MQPVLMACAAMGTRFELALLGEDERRSRAAGEAALEEITQWHRRLSYFEAESTISYINRHAGKRTVRVDREIIELLALCGRVWQASGGAFDPTVAALMRAGGFRSEARDERALAEALRVTGFQYVEVDEPAQTVRFKKPGIGLDLGAIGKGWALDRAREILADGGVRGALIHGGTSSVAVLGEGQAVALSKEVGAPVVRLHNAALGVSAGRGRVVEGHGHVLDPHTGESAAGIETAATVSLSAALADAWSTALLAAGARPAGMPEAVSSLIARREGHALQWEIHGPVRGMLVGPAPDEGAHMEVA